MQDANLNQVKSLNNRNTVSLKKQVTKSQDSSNQSIDEIFQNNPYNYVNSIPLDEYIYHLRYKVFPGVDKNILKEFLYYLFHFNRTNQLLFNGFHDFIKKRDIIGALNFLKSKINIEEVTNEFKDALKQYKVVTEETKDLNTILTLYVDINQPAHAQKLLRYLLYVDFKSRAVFDNYIKQYLNYENDTIREMSIPDFIYSSYKL